MSDNQDQLYHKFVGQTAKQIAESDDAPDDLRAISLHQEEAAILTKVVLKDGKIARLDWVGILRSGGSLKGDA